MLSQKGWADLGLVFRKLFISVAKKREELALGFYSCEDSG
jgi:hypothetical protein